MHAPIDGELAGVTDSADARGGTDALLPDLLRYGVDALAAARCEDDRSAASGERPMSEPTCRPDAVQNRTRIVEAARAALAEVYRRDVEELVTAAFALPAAYEPLEALRHWSGQTWTPAESSCSSPTSADWTETNGKQQYGL